jgi:TonB family protein
MLVGCQTSKNVPASKTPSSNSGIEVKTGAKAAIVGGLEALQRRLNYPSEARQRGIETVVEANVLVTETGKVGKISFDKEYGYGFEEAARRALRQVTFAPGRKNGQPISMFVTIPVRFALPDRSGQ